MKISQTHGLWLIDLIEEKSQCGLGAEWTFKCRNSECSLHHISRSFHTTPKENRVYGINMGLVLGLRLIRRRHSAAERLMSVLNLPGYVGRALWSSHTKALPKAANERSSIRNFLTAPSK